MSESVDASLPADFREFYQQFHADSSYQMAHIQWPLRAIPDHQLEPGESFYFQPETWHLQRLIDPASGYASHFTAITETIIQEEIINTGDQTSLVRRFMRDEQGWQLIYYQGVRKMN